MGPQAHVSIIVYEGDPVDLMVYRHTLLWFTFIEEDDQHQQRFICHIKGTNPTYEREMRDESNVPLMSSQSPTANIPVSRFKKPARREDITTLIESVPIHQLDREFNCQTWVDFALKSLRDEGYISGVDYDTAIDRMVDVISEARDEE